MFKNLNYDEAHKFVEETPGARWDGWDLLVWKENPSGWSQRNKRLANGNVVSGEFRKRMPKGRGWGVLERVAPNSKGLWKVKVNESSRTTRS